MGSKAVYDEGGGHFDPGGEISGSTMTICAIFMVFFFFNELILQLLFLNIENIKLFLNYITKYIFNNHSN